MGFTYYNGKFTFKIVDGEQLYWKDKLFKADSFLIGLVQNVC